MGTPRPIAPAATLPSQSFPTPGLQMNLDPIAAAQTLLSAQHHTAQLQQQAQSQSSPSPTASTSSSQPPLPSASTTKKDKKPRRSKVAEACRFCRRSHMSCDAGRPCGRCVKRDIAHLCREEPTTTAAPSANSKPALPPIATTTTSTPIASGSGVDNGGGASGSGNGNLIVNGSPHQAQSSSLHLDLGQQHNHNNAAAPHQPGLSNPGLSQPNLSFAPSYHQDDQHIPMLTSNFNLAMLDLASGQEGMGAGLGLDGFDGQAGGGGEGEFHGLGLSEFLQSLHDTPFLTDPQLQQPISSADNGGIGMSGIQESSGGQAQQDGGGAPIGRRETKSNGNSVPGSPINKTERFLLTAADQKDGSRSDRLARVIHAKFEAGLLRPYNHVAGYTRLMRWMADNMSQSSRQRTLHTLSEFRPAFRAIASGLTDLDLVFIEEAFERLLLDYDRVFSSMGIPSCLWRRTGEIYKGNKEFAALVGVPIEHLQGGKLAIYELMAEESAVNYWEKYGNIAFDSGQKAVLTSCVLVNQSVLSKKRKKVGGDKAKNREDAMINVSFSSYLLFRGRGRSEELICGVVGQQCCFSFTIRRDSYAIPSMIVGNFLRF
ncbi:hypothetical protein P7C70_g4930, partial [Phenoliferia sp. Uapishka_3]